MKRNSVIADYFAARKAAGKMMFALCGGRRSGKTYFVCQELLLRCYDSGDIVNVASMTAEQGRLGAYADCRNIIDSEPALKRLMIPLSSPREIRCRHNGGRMFFNSYQNSETAKGIACDWLFVNEANNFSKQQVVDLMANVRKGVIFDYNPNIQFWIVDYFTEEEICHTTWKDNKRFLTPLQKAYFANLKRLGGSPDSNAVDRRNYLVYYEGVYSELDGDIFTPTNMRLGTLPDHLSHYVIFGDPSALRGNDYFPLLLTARAEDGTIWAVDALSVNSGSRSDIVVKCMEWLRKYDGVRLFIEVNGFVGIDFYEFAINSGLPAEAWTSKGNKFERIVSQYESITRNMMFADTEVMREYLKQCYEFSEKCEHDDNIDAVASSVFAHRLIG